MNMDQRKFTPEYEDAVRAVFPPVEEGEPTRDVLRRETVQAFKSGFTRINYTWLSGRQDYLIMRPPGTDVKKFLPEYQEFIRVQTNVNGRGNAALNPEDDAKMLPQTELTYEDITDMPCGGIACEYGWSSGRQDALIYPQNAANATN